MKVFNLGFASLVALVPLGVVCPVCTLRVVSVHDVCVIHCSLYSVVDTVVYMIVCMFVDVLVYILCISVYAVAFISVCVCRCVQ